MSEIFSNGCRNALSLMLAAKLAEEKETQKVNKLLSEQLYSLQNFQSIGCKVYNF